MKKKIHSSALCLLSLLMTLQASAQNVAQPKTEADERLKVIPLEFSLKDPKQGKLPDIFKKLEIKVPIKNLDKFKTDNNSGGGWGSSGGGSGVACFANPKIAQEAQIFVDRNESLPKAMIDKIEVLKTLDLWEKSDFPLVETEDRSVEDLLHIAKLNMSFIVPMFMFRLEQGANLIQITNWDQNKNIPRIHDTKLRWPLPENCIQVQLVARYTKESYIAGNGPGLLAPTVRVDVNAELYARLDALNKAVLIMHEQVYLLAAMTGHQTSTSVRPITIGFFSKKMEGVEPVGSPRMRIRYTLIQEFGDYIRYFADEGDLVAEPFSQESRFNSFNKLMGILRDKIALCRDGKLPAEEMLPWRPDLKVHTCRDFVMNNSIIEKWIDEEMAFVYLGNYILDISLQQINSEFLMTPVKLPLLQSYADKTLRGSCVLLKHMQPDFRFKEMMQKALRYCDGAVKQDPSPKGKGRN